MISQRLGLPYMRGSVGYIVAVLIDALGTGLFLPLSLLYFKAVAGLPLGAVGLTLTGATFLTLPFTPATGILVDVLGARRVAILSQLLQAVGFVGYLFVRTIPLLAVMTMLITAGTRMFYTANAVLVAEIAVPDERDRWYGLVGALRSAGIGIGGIFAGVAIIAANRAGFQALVAANAASFFIAAALLVRLQTVPHQQHDRATTIAGYGAVLRDWPYLGFVASNLVLVLCSMVSSTALAIYILEALAAPRWTVGAIFPFTTALAVTGQTIIVRAIEKYRRTRVLLAAGIVRGASATLFALALVVPHRALVPYLFAVVSLFTIGGMLHAPTASALAADAGAVALRGRYLAVFEFSWGLASALAPGMFTALYAVGTAVPWVVLAGLAFGTVVPTLRLERHLPPQAVRRQYRISPFRPAVAIPKPE